MLGHFGTTILTMKGALRQFIDATLENCQRHRPFLQYLVEPFQVEFRPQGFLGFLAHFKDAQLAEHVRRGLAGIDDIAFHFAR